MKDAPSAHKAHVIITTLKYFAPVVYPIYLVVLVTFVRMDSFTMNVGATNKLLKMIVLCLIA